MREQSKLKEAQFFLNHMILQASDQSAFLYFLSAFLSASRSVLQYARAESKRSQERLRWYDEQVSNNPVIRFLKSKRDINIHERPIDAAKRSSVSITDTLNLSSSLEVKRIGRDGRTEIVHRSEDPTRPKPQQIPASVTTSLVFRGWKGSEDVIALCERYFSDLDRLVQDGQSRGFLSR